MERINFYPTKDEHGYLSNFARYPIELEGKSWPTSEHYYQAKKFIAEDLQEKVRLCKTPKDAAAIGRDRNLPLRSDWEQEKDWIMRYVVYEKFLQHKDIQDKLLSTGNAYLAEHTTVDKYWADGGDDSGKNMLGKILMEVRETISLEKEVEKSKKRGDWPYVY